MVRRSGYHGVVEPERSFEALRPAVERLQALERGHSRMTPAGAALNHVIVAIRMSANLLTRKLEFYGATGPTDLEGHARTVAELDALRSAVDSLRGMAGAYHPATPEARSLDHAVLALRMAADVLTSRPDFFRITSSDGNSPALP